MSSNVCSLTHTYFVDLMIQKSLYIVQIMYCRLSFAMYMYVKASSLLFT